MIATKPEEGARSSTIVSAAYQLGLAAFRRERLYDIERASAMQEAAVLALAGKVEVVPDESLLSDFPAHFPAEIEVSAKGTTHRKRVTAAYGDPSRPLDDAALMDKANRIFTQAGGTRPGSDLIALGLAGLKDRESCKAVAKAFASTPAAVGMLFAQ
jgi:2-methylcitrate dehydratase PrpD